MKTIWKTNRLMPLLARSTSPDQQPVGYEVFEADTYASSDEEGDFKCVSIDDIVQENRVLRKELFLLCEKLMQLEHNKSVATNNETEGDQTTEIANRIDHHQHQYDDIKNELHNLRLLNHELGRRALYLEEDRKKRENELVQLNLELLQLTPYKCQALDMKKCLDTLQSEKKNLQLLQTQMSNNYETEKLTRTSLEAQIHKFETQLQMEKETNANLKAQLTVNESIQKEATLQLLQQQRDTDSLHIETEQLKLKLQAINDELKHSQRRCESQAKEINRLKTLNDAASSTPPLLNQPPTVMKSEEDSTIVTSSIVTGQSQKQSNKQLMKRAPPRSLQKVESMEMIEDCTTCGDFSFLR